MAKKQIRTWFREVKDEGLRGALLKNMDACDARTRRDSFKGAVTMGFTWSDTPEGIAYWKAVANGGITTLPIKKRKLCGSVLSAPQFKISPEHYKTPSGMEAIDVIEAFSLNFRLGTACKYLLRAGKKEGETAIIDLNKLKWYVEREISNLEKQNGSENNANIQK